MSAPPLLSLERITKRFAGVVANDGISLDIAPGEIHALLGENGAGKSTLVKLIYGMMAPDAGEMRLHDRPYAPSSPSQARALGVGMVFQHFSLFDSLTVAENVALGLGLSPVAPGLAERITRLAASYGLDIDPARTVGLLSVGERQRVEIVRALLAEPRVLIMDEPTSVLTPQEADQLFLVLRRLASEGCSILYISHKLDEIRSLCDRATVLRHGRVVATCRPQDETPRSLAEMMLGASLVPAARPSDKALGANRFVIDGLSLAADEPFGVDLVDVSVEVRAGEIVGIAGIAGNGQSELMQAIIGERLSPDPAAIVVDGVAVGGQGPVERRRRGMAFVPEERLGHGAVPRFSLADNTLLSGAERQGLVRHGFILGGRATAFARDIIAACDVRSRGTASPAATLSGGNLQKFIVGREILQSPGVLVVAQPTWGLDAGAAAQIREMLLALAARGSAVLVLSQDLDELLEICTRIAVIAAGRLTPAEPVETLSIEKIGVRMGGRAASPPAAGDSAHA